MFIYSQFPFFNMANCEIEKKTDTNKDIARALELRRGIDRTLAESAVLFYDLKGYGKLLGKSKAWKKVDDESKYGRASSELVDVVEPFGRDKLDRSILEYERVREDARNALNFTFRDMAEISFVLAGSAGLFSGSLIHTYFFGGNPSSTFDWFISYLPGIFLFAGGTFSAAFSEGTKRNGPLGEFFELYERAERADKIIDNEFGRVGEMPKNYECLKYKQHI